MLVFFLLPIIPEHFQAICDLLVVGNHHAAIAVGPQVFARVKTKSRRMAQRAHALAFVARTVGLACVFNHHDPMLIGKLLDGIHVGRMPIQMNGENSFRAASDGSFDGRHVQSVGVRIDVDQHRLGASMRHAECGGDETVGGGDDLVTRTDIERPQREFECRRTGVHTDRIWHVAESGELFLEEAHLAPQDEIRFLDYLRYCVINLGGNRLVLDS